MSFKTFLDVVGHDFEHGLNLVLGDTSEIATAEASVITAINPTAGAIATQIASLSTQAYGIVTQTEQKFAALGQASGTGVQKFAEAVSILTPAAAQILGLAGQQLSTTVAALINGAVAVLNALPSDLAGGASPSLSTTSSTPTAAAQSPSRSTTAISASSTPTAN